MEQFEIPVVLIIFKRPEKSVHIVSRIAQVKPSKVYIISDEGRSDEEKKEVKRCRKMVENAITWNCTLVKDYATENRGVYDRIGLGAIRVFTEEKWAIFLEDDNLPQVSFFYYCQDLLKKYEADQRVLWICGTNYLESCSFQSGADYGFTKHMLPCGWASWGDKFRKNYDKDFSLFDIHTGRALRKTYSHYRLYRQDVRNWKMEIESARRNGRYKSWDYHMGFSLRVHQKLGIVPRLNQIENIGVDASSAHGGTSFENVMTKRLCGMRAYSMSFPLIHPQAVECDKHVEKQLAKIITAPVSFDVVGKASAMIRTALNIPADIRIIDYFRFNKDSGGTKTDG